MILTSSPGRLAKEFNDVVPGAYRSVTVDDIRMMTECGLIGHHSCYGESDIRIVIGVLRYELLRKKTIEKPQPSVIPEIQKCKMCGNPLLINPVNRHGRKKEYCASCEPLRLGIRYKKYKQTHQVKIVSMTRDVQLVAS